jgi:predicted aconitase with swiveling domain
MYDGKIEEAKRQAITDEDYRCVMLFGCILGDIPLIQWAFEYISLYLFLSLCQC